MQQEAPPRKRARRDDLSSMSLAQVVGQERQLILQKRERLPALRQKVQELQAIYDQNGLQLPRHLISAHKALARRLDDLRQEINHIESGAQEREFEEQVQPFFHAYNAAYGSSDSYKAIAKTCLRHHGDIQPLPGQGTSPNGVMMVNTMNAFVQQEKVSFQASIVREYLVQIKRVAPTVSMHIDDICPKCQLPMLIVPLRTIMFCDKCGYMSTFLDSTAAYVAYGEEIDFSSFSYKRINHFNEWLHQLQGKENITIPQSNMTAIMKELWSQRIQSPQEVNTKNVRAALKKLNLRNLYKHSACIVYRLTGVPPIRLTPQIERRCRLMFITMQPAFEKHCPEDRKNFLSYSYCLFKFFQLLGLKQHLHMFTLLKGRDKLVRQDSIMEQICHELNWEFTPSVIV